MVRVGSYNQRVLVQSRTVAKTANGEQQESFVDVGTYWAKVVSVRSQENQNADIETYTERYRFSFRSFTDTDAIGSGHRLTWRSRIYDVKQRSDPSNTREVVVVGELTAPNARDG